MDLAQTLVGHQIIQSLRMRTLYLLVCNVSCFEELISVDRARYLSNHLKIFLNYELVSYCVESFCTKKE